MIVPIADHACQQIGAAQEGRIHRRFSAEHKVVAAAGSNMTAIEHELLGRQSGLECRVVKISGQVGQFGPALGRLNVDFDHAGVGGDAQHRNARIARRLVAFEDYRQFHRFRCGFDGGNDFEIVLQLSDRRHEQIELALTHFGAHRGAGDPAGRLMVCGQRIGRGKLFRQPRSFAFFQPGQAAKAEQRIEFVFRCQRVVRVALRVDPGGTGAERHGVTLRQLADTPVHRQRRKRLGLIRLMQIRVIIFVRPGLRVERDAVADRGIARHQIAALGAQIPRPGLPARRTSRTQPGWVPSSSRCPRNRLACSP